MGDAVAGGVDGEGRVVLSLARGGHGSLRALHGLGPTNQDQSVFVSQAEHNVRYVLEKLAEADIES